MPGTSCRDRAVIARREALRAYRETLRSEEIEMARHWFITGASGGLGRHLVALALAEGDAVVTTV